MKRVFVLLFGLFLVTACDQGNDRLLRIGTNVRPGYEPLYLAREQGELDKDIHLIEYPSASEVIRAFRNRSLEAASLTLDEVLLLRESRLPVKIILVHDISNGADTIVAKPGIDSFADLKGKRVGVEASALGAFVITRALEVNGMAPRDIEVVNLDVNLHEEAFRSGQIDAAVTFEPVRTRLLNRGGHELFSSRQIPNEIVDVMVVYQDYYEQYPERVRALVDEWFEALKSMKKDSKAAYRIMSRHLQLTPEEVEASFSRLYIPDLEANRTLLSGDKPPLLTSLKNVQRVLEQKALIPKGIEVDGIISDTAVSQR